MEFVDSNVLVYAHDLSAGDRRERSADLLTRLWEESSGCLSTQVLTEFYAAVTRKLRLPARDAVAVIDDLRGWPLHRATVDDLIAAAGLQQKHQLQWWDALILQSAIRMNCSVLWTEDLSHGQRFGGLTVRNPFRDQ